MPNLAFFRESDGGVPVLDWFGQLAPPARVKCIAKLELLAIQGHHLRRPHADYLRDGIYELRAKQRGVNYRLLYFFHGEEAIIVSHGLVKSQSAVPPIEIERARRRKRDFEANPAAHTHRET
jgi:phage-related protein